MTKQSIFTTLTIISWPIGGTVLGLIVVPVAIAQYPDFINNNSYLLPISVLLVLICWILPFIFHQRAKAIHKLLSEATRFRSALALVVYAIVAVFVFIGGHFLLGFHRNHLAHIIARSTPILSRQYSRGNLPIVLSSSDPREGYYVMPIAGGQALPGIPFTFPLYSPARWPTQSDIKGKIGDVHDTMGILRITNQEDKSMIDIHLTLAVTFTEPTLEPNGGGACSGQSRVEKRDVVIRAIEGHRSASIFIVNKTGQCIDVKAPETICLTVAGEGPPRNAKLIQSTENIVDMVLPLWPIPPTREEWID